MRKKFDERIPRYTDLILPTFLALKELGGSGKNDEILTSVIQDLNLSDEIVDFPHKDSTSMSELSYQLAWARTYLFRAGATAALFRRAYRASPLCNTQGMVHPNNVDD